MSWGSSGPAFSSEMNRLLGQAETALLGRRVAPTPKQHDAPYQPPPPQPLRNATAALTEYRDPYSHPYLGPAAGRAELDPADMTRHVLVCMNEIRELRHELALEREARSTVMTAFAKRIKEEIGGDVRSTEHHLQRAMREMEADILQRITEQDNARALLKRSVDDALRQVKSYDRTHFDANEQHREGLEEMRSSVAQCVGLCHQLRSEVAQKLERESAAHAHRLDVELVRYADMQRQSQQALADTRRSVADEVGLVSKTITTLVDECWQRRLATMTKSVDDSLGAFRATHERQEQRVADINVKMAQFTKDVRSEIALATGDSKERLAGMESAMPLLSSRVDRFERKADSVFETANKLTAQTDAMQQTCDIVAVQVARSVERCQKLEDGVRERDDRLIKCESQLSGLAGLDRVKVDVEGLRKAITRVEGVMDHVRQIADRDERLVDTLQRNIDGSVERADAVEKKAHKVMARVETAEQRIMGFVDRLIALEEVSERQSSTVDQSKTSLELLTQRVSASEGRQRTTIDRVESGFKEVADRLVGAEGRSEAAVDSSARLDALSSTVRKDIERLEKRLGKVENNTSNALDNLRETRDAVDLVQREHSVTTKKLDQWKETLDRKSGVLETKLSEFDSTGLSLTDRFARNDKRVAALLEALEKRVEERVDGVSKRLEDVHTASTRRLTQDLVGSGARGAGTSVVDETLALEIGASRRRIDGLETRLRQLENQSTVRSEDTVQRHEVSGLAHQVRALEGAWRQLQERIATRERHDEEERRRGVTATTSLNQRSVQDVFATPDVSPVQQRSRPAAHSEALSKPTASAAVTSQQHFQQAAPRPESPSPTRQAQQSSVQQAMETRSSVSSMHGGDLLVDDVSEVTSIGQTTQGEIERLRGEGWGTAPAATSAAAVRGTSSGLPPLSDGTQRIPGTLAAPKDSSVGVAAKKRSPYSDTSESEREAGGTFTSPERPAPAPTAKSSHHTIADNFDDDEEFDIAADTSATFKLDDSAQYGSPFVGIAAASGRPDSNAAHASTLRAVDAAPAATVAPKSSQPTGGAASPSGGEMTTDDDLAAAMFGGRRQSSQRRREFIAGDTSASAGELMVPGRGDGVAVASAGSNSAAAVVAPSAAVTAPPAKKFHAKKSASAGRTSFDEDSDEEGDGIEEIAGSPREGSQARSKTSSRRSAASRRTTDVSLSLNSSKRHGGARSSRRGGDEETVEDIEDDDQLAEMLGFLDKKGPRR